MNFLGIDPGQSGALALLSEDLHEVQVWDCPSSPEAAADLLRGVVLEHRPALAGIEKVSAMPGQGVTSMFNFGQNAGGWRWALAVLQVPLLMVAPGKWQKAILDSGGGSTKERALSMARRMFPTIELSRKKDHGRADALLLALYAARWHRAGNQ